MNNIAFSPFNTYVSSYYFYSVLLRDAAQGKAAMTSSDTCLAARWHVFKALS